MIASTSILALYSWTLQQWLTKEPHPQNKMFDKIRRDVMCGKRNSLENKVYYIRMFFVINGLLLIILTLYFLLIHHDKFPIILYDDICVLSISITIAAFLYSCTPLPPQPKKIRSDIALHDKATN